MDRCDACGYVYAEHTGSDLVADIRSLGSRYRNVLGDPATTLEALRTRPEPETWSAIEYACHVRDVLLAQRERLFRALVEDTPGFAPIHREDRVVLDHYSDQDPATVAGQITVASDLLANAFGNMGDDAWQRDCIYNFPAPTRRDLKWFAAHTLHEGEHHLADIAKVLGRLS